MKIVVIGGASFIGSHLVEKLIADGHAVTILDNFSSGSLSNFDPVNKGKFDSFTMDLRIVTPDYLAIFFRDTDRVFHLAADHGGRGYVETMQVACSNNFAIDNNVLQACILAKVPRLIFASSGCIYPLYMQNDTRKEVYLSEEMATVKVHTGPVGTEWDHEALYPGGIDGLMQPDGLYGLAKLAMEKSLYHAYQETNLSSVSCRFFTVYGPRAKENHAIISFIARAFVKQDPFTIWGDGTQIRNWTYVDDIVKGLILAMEYSNAPHCTQLNLGTMEKITVDEAVSQTIELVRTLHSDWRDYTPGFTYQPNMPVGPVNRVADNSKYISLGGDEPLPFKDGLKKTLEWYFDTKDPLYIDENLSRLLIDRK